MKHLWFWLIMIIYHNPSMTMFIGIWRCPKLPRNDYFLQATGFEGSKDYIGISLLIMSHWLMNPLKQKSEGLMISSPCVVEKPADGHFARETHAGWVSRWERQLSSALINGKTKSFYHFGLVETALFQTSATTQKGTWYPQKWRVTTGIASSGGLSGIIWWLELKRLDVIRSSPPEWWISGACHYLRISSLHEPQDE